jgi:hypothetical protein
MTTSSGYILTNDALSLHVFITLCLVSVFKIYMIFIRMGKSFWIVNCGFAVFIIVYMLILNASDNGLVSRIPLTELFSSLIPLYAFFTSLGVNLFIIYVFFYFISKSFIYPFYYQGVKQLMSGNKNFFFASRNDPTVLNPTHFIPPKKSRILASCIRDIFKNGGEMEEYLKKIMTLDSSSYNFGLKALTG